MIDDEVLIRQAQASDRVAFATLYDRYYQPIYTRIYYRVSDRATAEELAANVFVRMIEKLGQYRSRGQPFLAWLYTIARNLLTDYYRQSGRATLVSLDDKLVSASDNPESITEALFTAECLQRAMRDLTEEQQEVIIAKFVEERSNAEVAALMGKSEGAVKSLQHRALAALHRAIDKEACYEV